MTEPFPIAGSFDTFVGRAQQTRGEVPPNPLVSLRDYAVSSTSSPTIAAPAATSVITGSSRTVATDPAFRYLGAGMVDAEASSGYADSLWAGYITDSAPDRGRCKFDFMTDGDEIEIRIRAIATSVKYRVWVDGLPHALSPSTASGLSGGGVYYWHIDFGSRAPRHILFEATNIQIIGVYGAPETTFWTASHPRGPKAVVIGDSFAAGTGGDWWWDSWAMEMGRRLGWDVFSSASGGTGYLSDGGGGGKVKFRDRLAADVTALEPDIVVVSGGFNDRVSYTESQVNTEAAALLDAIEADMPSALVLAIGTFSNSGVTSANSFTAMRDAVEDAATARDIPFVDPIGYPDLPSWVTGTGRVGSTVGNGNADFYTSSDGSHPSQAGHTYLGRRVAEGIAAALT